MSKVIKRNPKATREQLIYWFNTYQIDNTLGISTTIGNLRTLNSDILKRFLYGDKAYGSSLASEFNIDNFVGDNKKYEMITFKQSGNSNTLNPDQDTRCFYSLILEKINPGSATPENYKGMWLCVFCPRKVCNSVACGLFNIWKVNTGGVPESKLSWYTVAKKPGDVVHKYCITTDFVDSSKTTVGDKVIIGIVGNKVYLSPKSFYLEGMHEDILKRMPNINGMKIDIITINLEVPAE